MTAVIPIHREDPAPRQRPRRASRERQVSAQALHEVSQTVDGLPLCRDLLIEHLHRLNDRFRQLRTDHLAALAQLLRLSQAEVHEVASFYHHFDVVREDSHGAFAAPARLTVRVCDSLSCELAGASDLLERLPQLLGPEVRVLAAPCMGRC